jgi:hypothetical protein
MKSMVVLTVLVEVPEGTDRTAFTARVREELESCLEIFGGDDGPTFDIVRDDGVGGLEFNAE